MFLPICCLVKDKNSSDKIYHCVFHVPLSGDSRVLILSGVVMLNTLSGSAIVSRNRIHILPTIFGDG